MVINPNNKIDDPGFGFKDFIACLREAGKLQFIPKGKHVVFEEDEINFVFLVEQGVFRTYRWVGDKEVTIGFSFKGDIDTCPYAFINKTKSLDNIEALTDCKIVKVFRRDIDCLLQKCPEFSFFMQLLLSHYIEILVQRNIALRIKDAETFYVELKERQPEECNKIPLQYIASYLGISKERLSRIRKKWKPAYARDKPRYIST